MEEKILSGYEYMYNVYDMECFDNNAISKWKRILFLLVSAKLLEYTRNICKSRKCVSLCLCKYLSDNLSNLNDVILF